MLDNVDWLRFYSDWTYEQLLQEVFTCHRYQLGIVGRLATRSIPLEQAIRQIEGSQNREDVINEVIRSKAIERSNASE